MTAEEMIINLIMFGICFVHGYSFLFCGVVVTRSEKAFVLVCVSNAIFCLR